MGEVFFILGLVGGLIVPFVFLTGKGRIYWLVTMSTIGLVLVASEIISTVDTGGTISQHFWHWSVQHPVTGWLVIGMLFMGWVILLLHLAWKLITNRDYRKTFKND